MPAVATREPMLKLSYARSELADIDRMRQVHFAALDGMSQRDIANAVRLSQATVHRLIAKARMLGVHESIEEIVLLRFVGQIDSREMLRRLTSYEHWVPRVVDPVDGVLAEDSEAELDTLLEDGFLAEDEVDQIVAAHE